MTRGLKWARAKWRPRDAFFFIVGCAIAYHEVWIARDAEPLLIFTVLFLWGLIPAFWGDRPTTGAAAPQDPRSSLEPKGPSAPSSLSSPERGVRSSTEPPDKDQTW